MKRPNGEVLLGAFVVTIILAVIFQPGQSRAEAEGEDEYNLTLTVQAQVALDDQGQLQVLRWEATSSAADDEQYLAARAATMLRLCRRYLTSEIVADRPDNMRELFGRAVMEGAQ